jgi:Prokaryotic homologs of the JAB domain
MLEATTSFSIRCGTEIVTVTAGRTRVAEGHPIAAARPKDFRRVVGSPAGARERVHCDGLGDELAVSTPRSFTPQPAPPSGDSIDVHELWRRRGGPRPKPPRWFLPTTVRTRLSDMTSRYTVRLAPTARRDLIEDLKATTGRDGLEAGAALYGARPLTWADVIVVSRVGTVGDALRWPRAMARDHVHDALQAERFRKQSDGRAVEIGFAHSHLSTDSMPSETDLRHFSQMRALLDMRAFVAIIATPDPERRWNDCHLDAWVIRETSPGHDICEAGALVT